MNTTTDRHFANTPMKGAQGAPLRQPSPTGHPARTAGGIFTPARSERRARRSGVTTYAGAKTTNINVS